MASARTGSAPTRTSLSSHLAGILVRGHHRYESRPGWNNLGPRLSGSKERMPASPAHQARIIVAAGSGAGTWSRPRWEARFGGYSSGDPPQGVSVRPQRGSAQLATGLTALEAGPSISPSGSGPPPSASSSGRWRCPRRSQALRPRDLEPHRRRHPPIVGQPCTLCGRGLHASRRLLRFRR
jgi:hypothetical protein